MMASIFKSLSEMVPVQLPLFGWREITMARLPGLPLILARTVTQYVESLDNPLNVYEVASVTAVVFISSPCSVITS